MPWAEVAAEFILEEVVADVAITEFAGDILATDIGVGVATAGQAGFSVSGFLTNAAVGLAKSYALQTIAGLFADKPATQSMDQVARTALINSVSNIAAIPVIYGSRLLGGIRILTELSGTNNEFLHLIFAWGEGPISAVRNLYIDGELDSDPRFAGIVYREDYLGTDGQAASAALVAALPGKWTSACTLSGVAYTYLRLTWNPTAYARGLPTVTADLDGRTLIDPRTGLTVFSHNPALAVRDYLTNARYGRGIPPASIDDATFVDIANHCDEVLTVPTAVGTTTQVRYACDGILSVDVQPLDNLTQLLSSCRGLLVFSGGQYKLRSDRVTTPTTFALTEDNIVGAWSITLGSKRTRFNRVKVQFFDSDQSWQSNLGVAESAVFRAADNGLVLEGSAALVFTADLYRAQQFAQMQMKASRFGIVTQFTATIAAMQLEVGDVVPVTHSTPGWVAKLFRVMELELMATDEVRLTLAEYDASVYTLDDLVYVNPPPATNLPDPFRVGVPGNPSVAELLYETGGGVKSAAIVNWGASADAFVTNGGYYELEYKALLEPLYTRVSGITSTTVQLNDLPIGFYNFRVRAVNTMGAVSAYSDVVTKELLGVTAPPADVTGFTVIKSTGFALAQWDLPIDLDVRIGGFVVIRHSPLTTGATWGDGIILESFPGSVVQGLTPLITGTYMTKALDASGNYSANAAIFVATEGMITGFTTVGTSTQHPTFTGTKTNVAVVGSALQLDGSTLIDSMTDLIDDWPAGDLGGISPAGRYDFDTYMDLTTVATRRFEADISAVSFDTGDTIDVRSALIDDWDAFDGNVINDCDVTLYAEITNDNPAGTPTWSERHPFFVADFTCRAARFSLDFVSGQSTHNIAVSTLVVHAKIPA